MDSDLGDTDKTGLSDVMLVLDGHLADIVGLTEILNSIHPGHPSQPLLNVTYNTFYEATKLAARALSFPEITPHVMRHSGPSIDALHRSRHHDDIMVRGRWSATGTVNRYRKPGRVADIRPQFSIAQQTWSSSLLPTAKRWLSGIAVPTIFPVV